MNVVTIQNDVLNAAKIESRAEERTKGQQEERIKNAGDLKKWGIPLDVIAQATGLNLEEIGQPLTLIVQKFPLPLASGSQKPKEDAVQI